MLVEDSSHLLTTVPKPFEMKSTAMKYHLFLDLDETLIHSFTTARMDFESEEERKEHFLQLEKQLTIENGVAPT